ncbi:Sensor protein KdpD [Streptomyces violaceorubidus]
MCLDLRGARRVGLPISSPEDGGRYMPVGDHMALALTGRVLPAEDRRVLAAFAAQAAVVLDRRRLREEADQARALAEGNRIRTALLAAVSHDLRTPLAGIKAAVTSLRSHARGLVPGGPGGAARRHRGGRRPPRPPGGQPARHVPPADRHRHPADPRDRRGRGGADGARRGARGQRRTGHPRDAAHGRRGRRAPGAGAGEPGGERRQVQSGRPHRPGRRQRPRRPRRGTGRGPGGRACRTRPRTAPPSSPSSATATPRAGPGWDSAAVARGFAEAMGGPLCRATPGGGLTMVLTLRAVGSSGGAPGPAHHLATAERQAAR